MLRTSGRNDTGSRQKAVVSKSKHSAMRGLQVMKCTDAKARSKEQLLVAQGQEILLYLP